jgi:hypothetical protein
MANSRDEWETFVSQALDDGEGPRFDALTALLEQVVSSDGESADSTMASRLLESLKAGDATVEELLDLLISANADIPGRPQPPSTRPPRRPSERPTLMYLTEWRSTGGEIRGPGSAEGAREPGPI